MLVFLLQFTFSRWRAKRTQNRLFQRFFTGIVVLPGVGGVELAQGQQHSLYLVDLLSVRFQLETTLIGLKRFITARQSMQAS